jgi:hypothetical protein
MVALWIIVMIVVLFGLVTALVAALIALRMQHRIFERMNQEREAWQQAQEGRQRTWEVRQGKHALELERMLNGQIEGVRKDFREWSAQVEDQQRAYEERMRVEQELARLPHIEAIELPFQRHGSRPRPAHWQPPALFGVDLRGRSLARRYIGMADLRNAMLSGTDWYMSDLSDACLSGADLSGANLTGVNLAGADLRGANLSGANLLVADLHRAVLYGAILRDVQNLTLEQLNGAFFDQTTSLDSHLLPVQTTAAEAPAWQVLPATPSPLEVAVAALVVAEQPEGDVLVAEPSIPSVDIASLQVPAIEPVALAEELPVERASVSAAQPAQEQTEPEAPPAVVVAAEAEQPDAVTPVVVELPVQGQGATEVDLLDAGDDTPDMAGGKIIQLPARVARTDLSAGSEKKRAPRGTTSRRKQKDSSNRVSKISELAREDDKQTRAN